MMRLVLLAVALVVVANASECSDNGCSGTGACLLIEGNDQYTCEVNPSHFTDKSVCDEDDGIWCQVEGANYGKCTWRAVDSNDCPTEEERLELPDCEDFVYGNHGDMCIFYKPFDYDYDYHLGENWHYFAGMLNNCAGSDVFYCNTSEDECTWVELESHECPDSKDYDHSAYEECAKDFSLDHNEVCIVRDYDYLGSDYDRTLPDTDNCGDLDLFRCDRGTSCSWVRHKDDSTCECLQLDDDCLEDDNCELDDTCKRYIVHGAPHSKRCLEKGGCDTRTAFVSKHHNVRCCRDGDDPDNDFHFVRDFRGFQKKHGKGIFNKLQAVYPDMSTVCKDVSVYMGGRFTRNNCVSNRKATYTEADEFCAQKGGRLCTVEEVEAGCTLKAGCGGKSRMIWTSSHDD